MRVIQYLIKALRDSAIFNPEVQVAPSCILWPDKDRQWEAAILRLQSEVPELLVLGDYAPENRTGPAIWLRCVMAGTTADISLPADRVPIFYLPGVSRQDLRAVESCPEPLKPLAELQYRAVYLPWLEESARYLQKLVDGADYPGGTIATVKSIPAKSGECVLFVDGLRFDAARRLASMLTAKGCSVGERITWTALPSVTATGKAAVSPVRDKIGGAAAGLPKVEFTDVVWRGLRCTVAIDGQYDDLSLDIRTEPGNPSSSVVVSVKTLTDNGTASVVVENEDLEGQPAFLVLLSSRGELVAEAHTVIGGE